MTLVDKPFTPRLPPGDTRILAVRAYQKVRNVGDRITAQIAERVSGLACVARPIAGPPTPHLLSLGSVYSGASAQSVVWGTGWMGPDFELPLLPAGQISALRGQHSAQALRRAGIALGDIALGDPGVLVARLFPPTTPVTAQPGRLGLVPHYADRRHPAVQALMQDPEVLLLDVHAEPEDFLQQMRGCAAIASSSLHGLIFADALGLPNVWLDIGGQLGGGHFKFHDYYSTTRAPKTAATQLLPTTTRRQLLDTAELSDSRGLVDDLLAAFPLDLLERQGAIRPRPPGLVPLADCRRALPQLFIGAGMAAPDAIHPWQTLPAPLARTPAGLQAALGQIQSRLQAWAELPHFALLLGEPASATVDLAAAVAGSWDLLDRSAAAELVLWPLDDSLPRDAAHALRPGAELAALLAGPRPWLCSFKGPGAQLRPGRFARVGAP